jgi:hypothetical protein
MRLARRAQKSFGLRSEVNHTRHLRHTRRDIQEERDFNRSERRGRSEIRTCMYSLVCLVFLVWFKLANNNQPPYKNPPYKVYLCEELDIPLLGRGSGRSPKFGDAFLFLLERKRNKKFKRVRKGGCLFLKCPITNSRLGETLKSKDLRLDTMLRAITRFLEALYFSMCAV